MTTTRLEARNARTGQHRKLARDVTVPARDIVGNAEVRAMCGGVTRHTLIRWRDREGFPQPIRRLEAGEIWDAREVNAWLHARNRRT